MSGLWIGFGKRLFDLVMAVGLLLVLGPVLLVVAMLVRLKLGSPILYSQRRLGQKATEFTLYKFRSMTSEVDASGNLLPDEVRLTGFGKWLRSSSLDELPQIINILKAQSVKVLFLIGNLAVFHFTGANINNDCLLLQFTETESILNLWRRSIYGSAKRFYYYADYAIYKA